MPVADRREFLLKSGALLMTGVAGVGASGMARAAGWQAISPADAGFKPDLEGRFNALQANGKLAGLHGVVALRHGRIVFEKYMAGPDARWGEPLGKVSFGPDTLHDMRSVTKSVVGLLYGVALASQKVPAPDQPLLAQFPEYPDLAANPKLAPLTVAHALTMTLGTEWNENVPYTDPANSEIAMEMASDRYRFILERPVVTTPGRGWIYNGGAPALLARLIEKGTGQSLPAFANTVLFAPLDIGKTEWVQGADGVPSAASGLRLTPRDLARIGQMVLAGGKWHGRQVVPKAWLDASLRPAAVVDDTRRYGYLWYVGEIPLNTRGGVIGQRWAGAFGNGGQRLFVFPDLDFVLAVTAGNYDTPDQWVAPVVALRQVFLASLAE
ncbi:serine hydrolase domain-containing protein [Cupriavidus sp. YAF13]|uniref:serine hydrolase domain-containing protein n=1 Tax=Cupriavidus sp. YAF13 TaxID=3233075 RepID=UPI003F9267E6